MRSRAASSFWWIPPKPPFDITRTRSPSLASTAIRETIAGLREQNREGRILAVFEPRSNTLKKGVMKEALPGSFAQADRVYIFSAGLTWDAGLLFAPLGPRARCEADLGGLVAAIAAEARDGDRVLVMSNGGFGGIHQKLLAALERN